MMLKKMLIVIPLVLCALVGRSESITIGDFTYSYSLSTKEGSITKYNGSSENVVIPSTFSAPETYKDKDGETHTRHHTITVTAIGDSAFQNNTTIKSVIFHDKLETIGWQAFYGCWNLRIDIELSNVTSIGSRAFQGAGIKSIKTSSALKSLGGLAFWNCGNLQEAEINGTGLNLNGSSGLFWDCPNLKKVTFGSGVTSLYLQNGSGWGTCSGTFDGCTNLQSVIVGSGVSSVPASFLYRAGNERDKLSVSFASPVTSVGNDAFCNSNITNIDLRLSNCTVGSYAFAYCGAEMWGVDFSQVTSLGNSAFCGCWNLQRDIDLSNATYIDTRAFQGAGIKTIKTSAELKTLGSMAFWNCGNLREAEINGTGLDLFNATMLFNSCPNLTKVSFGDGVARLPNSNGGSSPFSGCTNLREFSVGSGVTEVPSRLLSSVGSGDGISVSFDSPLTTVGYSAFYNGNITNLYIRLSQCTVAGYAFSGCPAVNERNIDFTQIASIGESAFYACGGIRGNLDISNATSIGSGAFQNCAGITSAKIGSGVSSVGSSAFRSCSNLSSLTFLGAPPQVGNYAFNNVKSGATGTYTAAHVAEWEMVIDSKGYWNGLKMKPSYYTVIYDANNGTGETFSQTVEWGEPQQAADGTFTWEGHYFMGWAFEDVGGSTLGSSDVIPEPQDGNSVTLYGQWATFEPVAVDWWNAGSIILKATRVAVKEGEDIFLSCCDEVSADSNDAHWEYIEDFGRTSDEDGIRITDTQFAVRLGGIPAVRYRLQVGKSVDDIRATMYCTTRTRYAIAIGLSSWGFADLDDTGGADNAMAFANIANRLGGVDPANVRTCINANAKTNNVRTAFAETAKKVIPGDICIFFINTHGGMFDDNGGKYAVLCMYDGYYEDEELAQDIASMGSDVSIIGIVSACHSGGLFDNDSLSGDSIEWHLSNGLANCPLNVAWITSADAATSSYGIFSKFLLDYGWSNGFAGEDGFSFLDLASYAKRRYDALFSGIVFYGEGDPKMAQIWNESLLGRVAASLSGCGLNEETPPPAPGNFAAAQGVSRANISVSWDAVEGADDYWVFFKFADMNNWLGSWETSRTSIPFAIRKDDKQLGKYYELVMSTSEEYPMVFCIKAISWENGISELSNDTNGWIDSSWDVIFDAGQGYVIGAWMGEIAEPGSRRFKKTLRKGESLVLTQLPEATRNGFTLTGWKTASGKRASTNATVWAQTSYMADWTGMPQDYVNNHEKIREASGGDIATAAAMTAANGFRTVGECYELGIDPEDPNDDLKIAEFKMKDGKPEITLNHTKDGSGNSFEDRVKILGKAELTDAEWQEVPPEGNPAHRFFKVGVEMP